MNNKVNTIYEIENYIEHCKTTMFSKDKIIVDKTVLSNMLDNIKHQIEDMESKSCKLSLLDSQIIKDNRESEHMLNLITKKESINVDDIESARDYLARIPCREFVFVCGTGLGCSNCPHYHLQMVFDKLANSYINDSVDK